MSAPLLLIYEIKDKASKVQTKKAYREFKHWVKNLLATYHDAAVEKVANICLYSLQEQFA